jgi:hypothetical protein
MAYLDLEIGFSAGIMSKAATTDRLTSLERQVILVSRGDSIRSVRQRRGTDWMLEIFSGVEHVRTLADEKLKALRRYAVIRRVHGHHMNSCELVRIKRAGFTETKLAIVHRMVDPWRVPVSKYATGRQILLILSVIALCSLLFPLVEEVVGDEMVAGLLLGIAVVTSLPTFLVTDRRP